MTELHVTTSKHSPKWSFLLFSTTLWPITFHNHSNIWEFASEKMLHWWIFTASLMTGPRKMIWSSNLKTQKSFISLYLWSTAWLQWNFRRMWYKVLARGERWEREVIEQTKKKKLIPNLLNFLNRKIPNLDGKAWNPRKLFRLVKKNSFRQDPPLNGL